jgi:AraC-like DNA-binding protein
MNAPAEQYTGSADYAHAVASACQRFACALLTIEPGVFVSAITRLTLDIPDADCRADFVFGWALILRTVLEGALAHHTLFHRCFCVGDRSCKFDAPRVDCCHTRFGDRTFESVIRWATDHARTFDSVHSWPPAAHAARLLQKASAKEWYVGDIARAVNVSAATLERGFRKVYGVSVQQYQSLVRLRNVALALRTDGGAIEGVILEQGYRSSKDVYVPFRRVTGLTVATVRQLTESQFASLVDGPLALPVPGCSHDRRRLATTAWRRADSKLSPGCSHNTGPSSRWWEPSLTVWRRTPNAPPDKRRALASPFASLQSIDFERVNGGVDEARTRDLRRDRPAF